MPGDPSERLARVEERLGELRREFDKRMRDADERSDRVRELEAAMKLLLQAQKVAREQEDRQYRRLELRIQILTLVVGLAAVVSSVVAVYAHA